MRAGYSFSHLVSRFTIFSRAALSPGKSLSPVGYMSAQCAVPIHFK